MEPDTTVTADIGQDASDIFTEIIPKYGKVALLFYIPDSIKDRDTFVSLIKQNGGNIAKFHESFTYQLGTEGANIQNEYYPGSIYSLKWIVESVEKGQLQDKADYSLYNVSTGKDFPFQK